MNMAGKLPPRIARLEGGVSIWGSTVVACGVAPRFWMLLVLASEGNYCVRYDPEGLCVLDITALYCCYESCNCLDIVISTATKQSSCMVHVFII